MIDNLILIIKQKMWVYKKIKYKYKKWIKNPYKN